VFHIGYKGREVFPTELLKKEFGNKATIMGSVDTKLMINPNPKAVYDQAATSIKAVATAREDTSSAALANAPCTRSPVTSLP
jgi:hypothetical protein